MNSRERFLLAMQHKIPDRTPLDGWFSMPVWKNLKKSEDIVSDEELRRRFGEGGRKLVREEFDWDKIILDIEKVYNEVVL